MSNEELYTCCFCGHKLSFKETHNAEPVTKKGRCCEDCHKNIVLPYRFGVLLYHVYRA